MKRPPSSLAALHLAALHLPALYLAGSGSALADHQTPNLKGFKTVCVTVGYRERDKENGGVLGKLTERMFGALDGAGIKTEDGCKLAGGVGGGTQLNLAYTFTTLTSGVAYDAALEGWLDSSGPYRDVTLWRDSYFGTIDAGAGAIQAADLLDELMKSFIQQWDSAH